MPTASPRLDDFANAAPAGRPHFFAALPSDMTSRLLDRAMPVKLDPGQVLFLAGDPGDGCYLIDDGLLKVELASENGIQRILALLRPGSVVGELSLIDGHPRSASVSALKAARLRFIPRIAFDDLVARDAAICRAIAVLLAGRLRDTNLALATANFMAVKGRVAVALVALAEGFGQDVGSGRILIKVKLGQADIAAMAGVSRETASRMLNDWLRRGDISRLAGYYCLERPQVITRAAR
ncbi:Crp/Fnr family transcriptional regulator [Phreatobacter stygius]|uniref:Crp/Fnr family transcriptional regulator n=1 Tax=Phreatobacter stygius TaxID=1940610 RepID=A0A4D7B5X1_9HYPH|nr:Crp/Fnr family transcriptional regulator [Phreatobacter stygius]QCI65116.1 Crp/Fnr family transcriptional regulator [Phreatobacter stygius]